MKGIVSFIFSGMLANNGMHRTAIPLALHGRR
jgi:hypothetical protein